MNKKLTAVLLALALMLVLAPSAFATTVFPEPPVQEVKADEDVVFDVAWFAGSPGLVRAFIQSSSLYLEVTDSEDNVVFAVSPPESRTYWQPIEPAPAEFLEFFPRANPKAKTPISFAPWQVVVLEAQRLEPGQTYTLFWEGSWHHQLVDLFDYDGDGKLDHIPPGSMSATVSLEVVE